MTDDNIKTLVSELVEQKLEELLGDTDADRELNEEVKSRLKRFFDAESRGEVGVPAAEFARKYGVDWWAAWRVVFRPETKQDCERLCPQVLMLINELSSLTLRLTKHTKTEKLSCTGRIHISIKEWVL